MVAPVNPAGAGWAGGRAGLQSAAAAGTTVGEVSESFGQALIRALDAVNAVQQRADRAAEAFALGEQRDVAELMIATEQARLAMELTLQIRNKVLEAYQEIIRIQV